MRCGCAVLVLLLAAGCTATSRPGESPSAMTSPRATQVSYGNGPFKVEYEVDRPGRIVGRIYNEYQSPVRAIQLLVQALDENGRVIQEQREWVGGEVAPLGDRPFVLTGLPPAANYVVRVHSYQIEQYHTRRWFR